MTDTHGALEPEDFSPSPPSGPAPPAPREIHLWSVRLDPPPARVAAVRRRLDAEETARADRFRFERHRRRFAVGRGAVRELLAAYLGVAPEAIRFGYGEKGKPFLAAPAHGGAANLRFNLTNSHELALVAVATGVELGVDVEHLRPMPDAEQIAERFFSPAERWALAAVALEEAVGAGGEAARDAAFFNAWTRKEAYLKAVGDGLTAALDRFDVTLAPGEPARLLALDGSAEAAARWSLFHLRPEAGYVGALAVPDPGPWRLRGWRWD